MTPRLQVTNLSITYGKHKALSHISMVALPGRVTGVIGSNGAGKSTFVKAICGHLSSDSGEIFIDGQNLKNSQQRSQLIGLVPQDIGLYDHLTSLENLMHFGAMFQVPVKRRRERAKELLESVGLSDKAKTLISALSGGMKRRVNVCCALMHSPQLIILDEPTAGLDIPARDKLHIFIKEIAKTGIGVLLVTHELDQVEWVCDQLLILNQGEAVSFGRPTEILDRFFGDAHEIRLNLSKPPRTELVEILYSQGFRQRPISLEWDILVPYAKKAIVEKLTFDLQSRFGEIKTVAIKKPDFTRLLDNMSQINRHNSGQPCD